MWDVALLVGAAPWSRPTSVYVAFLAIINAFMQGTFIYILYNTELTQPTFSEETILQLRTWRRNIAHDIDHFDELAGASLAERVCRGDAGLHMSATQSRTYRLLEQYLGGGQVGTLMCSVSLLGWYLTCSKEISTTFSVLRALEAIPVASHTEMRVDKDGMYRILQVTSRRRLAALLLAGMRGAIAVSMLISGTMFLIYTIELSRLMLQVVTPPLHDRYTA